MNDRERIEKLESDLAFVVRHIELRDNGHATVSEFERWSYIREQYPRYFSRDPGSYKKPFDKKVAE